jgi:hypothetical protein
LEEGGPIFQIYLVNIQSCWRCILFSLAKQNTKLLIQLIYQVKFRELLEMLLVLVLVFCTPINTYQTNTLDAWMHVLLLHLMLLLQSLEDLEVERKRSKRGGVHQN